MDVKEIKSTLKAAREAIRQKEFKEAIRHCKAVLKADKDNYNAWVFIGVAAEGLDQPDQAVKAFERAIDASPEQLLAWQGLCNFYEKSDSEDNKTALVQVYEKLVVLYKGDKEKWMETIMKLAELQSRLGNVEKAVGCYHSALKEISDRGTQTQIWRKLIVLLGSATSLTVDQENMLLEAYKVVLTSEEAKDQKSLIKPYLELLQKREDYGEIESESRRLSATFPDSVYPLQIVLQLELDSQVVSQARCPEKVASVCDKLRTLCPVEPILLLGDGFLSMCNRDFTSAKATLTKGVKNCPLVICGYVYLADVLKFTNDNKGVIKISEQGIEKLKTKESKLYCSRTEVEHHLSLLIVKSYICQSDLQKAEVILKEMMDRRPGEQEVFLLVDVYLRQGETTLVEELLQEHRGMMTDGGEVCAIKGRIALIKKEYLTAIEHLEKAIKQDGSKSEYYFHLGCVHWAMREDEKPTDQSAIQKAFTSWLQAAKLDPNNGEIFRCLGNFYASVQKDLVKAKRCYQKSFSLNPDNVETSAALCDSLTAAGDEDAAHSILLKATSQASAGSGKWAWLRLGLYQVKNSDLTQAVTSFQAALRADPTDQHVWECLAEAYLNRGSYTAALKAFTKALELDATSVYCLFQIAFIKQTLGEFKEAAEEYNAVLQISPQYVPALKGLGETLILLARSHLKQSFNLRAKTNCSEAIAYLTEAASHRPDLSCLWKLLGDACTILQPLSQVDFSMSVPLKLLEPGTRTGETKTNLTKEELLQLGARCYGQALKLLPECASLWHDLGTNYFYQSQLLTGAAAVTMATKALQILQKAVTLDPLDFRHWTAVGRVACSSEVYNPSLAQHCFIKSILTERNNVVAWTNLATLYLKNDNVKLAHDAFTVAQSLDPTYVSCWIGQAMIAETVGHEDAMDLFRHTTELGNHLESTLGYGHWVCTVMRDLQKRDSEMYKYCIEQMSALPVASDALAKYLDRVRTNATAYNMYGMLLEKQGLLQSACKAFDSALSILLTSDSSADRIKQARSNLARVLCKAGDYEESVHQYQTLGTDMRLEEVCGLALAHYKLEQLTQSFHAYEKALELAETDGDRSHIYAALGMVAYKFGDTEGVKTALFKCSQTTPSSNQGLAALCSFGFLQSDEALLTAALEELLNRKSLDILPVVVLLSAAQHILQGDKIAAGSVISQSIEEHPNNAALWDIQSSVILRLDPKKSQQAATAAKRCQNLDVTYAKKALLKQTLALLATGSNQKLDPNSSHHDNKFWTAQKAFHLAPDDPDNAISLVSALHSEAVLAENFAKKEALLKTQLRFTSFLLQDSSNLSPEVYLWLGEMHVLALMLTDRLDDARTFISQSESSGDNGRLELLKEVLEAYLTGDETKLIQLAKKSPVSTFVWQLVVGLSCQNSGMSDSEVYTHCLQLFSPAIRLAHMAFQQLMKGESEQANWQAVFEESCEEVLKKDPNCSAVMLMKALLVYQENPRLSKHNLQQLLENKAKNSCGEYVLSLARKLVIQILTETKKDPQALKDFLKDCEEIGDSAVMDWYNSTYQDTGTSTPGTVKEQHVTDYWEATDN